MQRDVLLESLQDLDVFGAGVLGSGELLGVSYEDPKRALKEQAASEREELTGHIDGSHQGGFTGVGRF